ncbi:MAG: DUF2760 domain-containing protein [Deltaproteobacteria bacterium]|nr:DUF2760 domain-containing protein [Deltaproteobacteria bacterium]
MKKKNKSQPTASRTISPDPRQPSAGALFVTILVATCAAAAAGALLLWGILDPLGTPPISPGKVSPVFSLARALSLGGGIIVLILAVILAWRASRPARRRLPAGPPTPTSKDKLEDRADEARETRLFVHLLARLQREGRLLDFLAEDLDAYDDAQIGAAARSVHAGCRRVVDKLLAPRPVMAEGEEASVTLDEHYDATAVTLTGRVGDKPPFQGIVRHAGWRATRIDIPVLAKETDPTIIAPAEVEVVGGSG